MFIRNAWYVAAWADEIEPSTAGAPHLQRARGAVPRRAAAAPRALIDMCCHRGAPLHMGKVVEQGLQCGYHGLIFDRTGACVRIPGQDAHPGARPRAVAFPWWSRMRSCGSGWAIRRRPIPRHRRLPYHNDTMNWPHKHTMYPIKAGRHADGGQSDGPDASGLRARLDHRRQSDAACRGEDGDGAHAARA